MGKVLFFSEKQFSKRFPNAKKGRIAPSRPRPEWRNPVQFQLKRPEWQVCHGFSKTSETGFRAWLELGNFVLDLSQVSEAVYFSIVVGRATCARVDEFVSKNRLSRAEFYRAHGISGVRKYGKEMVRAQLDLNRSYGPWKDAA